MSTAEDAQAAEAIRVRLVDWQARHGRRELPWQTPATPYRVWISEVMLQQTRVETVVPYFQRFIERFPDVTALAGGELDEILRLWAGLGYYARARHLHAAACTLADRGETELPADLDALRALPGIGPSTAGAIRSLGHGLPAAILDGNVKRVLARLDAVSGWPGETRIARRLWERSEALVPRDERCAAFNQGLMDLGALVCTPRSPRCGDCPLAGHCQGRARGEAESLPSPRPRRQRPERYTQLLLIEHEGALLLERRPPSGVWGGLWSLPECPAGADPVAAARELGAICRPLGALPERTHGFTHFRLIMTPVRLAWLEQAEALADGAERLHWFRPGTEGLPGVPAPIRRIVAAAGAGSEVADGQRA